MWRTGWNGLEVTLKPANVTPSTFGLVASTVLDDQVDTQPLVVVGQTIEVDARSEGAQGAGGRQRLGSRTVAYVTTEGNTVYAIDGKSGAILKSRNLGAPVKAPLGCINNGPNVGINGTPTIDVEKQRLYVIAYVQGGSGPLYQLHALYPATLGDIPGSPVTVAASHRLSDGTTYAFNASVQHQRPALLQANGNVYAAFGSFCDFNPNDPDSAPPAIPRKQGATGVAPVLPPTIRTTLPSSRGWILGWNATTLAPLPANGLTDTLATSPPFLWYPSYFLASVWMSGYGLAADSAGYLYFVTGNGNPATWADPRSLQESVVKLSPDLSTVVDVFTPTADTTPPSNGHALDLGDLDFGSGGVLLLPDQPGPWPHLAVAAGKVGRLFILNRDNLTYFRHIPDITHLDPGADIGKCFCGPSYFQGSDGVGRIVSSGGTQVKLWKITPVPAITPWLFLEATSAAVQDATQEPGFFTSISSALYNKGTAIIWAVGRPGSDRVVTLHAFDGAPRGDTLTQLWSGVAGTWPNMTGNANLVPTVSEGRVYVASYKRLAIFGLVSPPTSRATRRGAAPTIAGYEHDPRR
jgi:hypothetical protein